MDKSYDIDIYLEDNNHLNYADSRIALESYIHDIANQYINTNTYLRE